MVRIEEYLRENKMGDEARLLLQVHDELVFEIREDKVQELGAAIKKIMENVVPEKDRHGIPFLVEGKVGHNWGEMKPL